MKRNINIFAQQSVGKAFAVGPEIPLKNIKNTFRLTHMKKVLFPLLAVVVMTTGCNQNKNAYVNSGSLAGTRVNEPGVSYHIQTQRNTVLNYLSTHDCITTTEVMSLLNLSATQGRKVLRDLAEDGILISLGHNKNRRYVKAPALDRTDETIE